MTWLRSHWLQVLATLLAVTLVGALVNRAKWLGIAEAAEARADSIAVIERDLRAENEAATLRRDALADSLQVERQSRANERAQSAARIAEATRRASEVADDLETRLDSIGAALFAEYQAEVDARDAERLAIIASLEADTASLSLELAEERALSELRLDGWNASRAENAELRAANDALRNAVAPSFFTRIFESWETHAAIAGLAYLGGKIGP